MRMSQPSQVTARCVLVIIRPLPKFYSEKLPPLSNGSEPGWSRNGDVCILNYFNTAGQIPSITSLLQGDAAGAVFMVGFREPS